MPYVTVQVEVDAEKVLRRLDEEDLEELGLVAIEDQEPEAGDWHLVHEAIRRADFHKAAELITSIAADCGIDLPPFSMARVA